MESNKGVLVIYTGGTIGSKPSDPSDPNSPLIVVGLDEFKIVSLKLLGGFYPFVIDFCSPGFFDSCNVGLEEWKAIARIIRENRHSYEGIVILHGTDTMAYTASALSFMIKFLDFPIIITGAQRSFMEQKRNDGFQNLTTSIEFANAKYSKIPIIPEVVICFDDKIYRGNRATKIDASGFDAFATPNYPILAEAQEQLIVYKNRIKKIPGTKKMKVDDWIEPEVMPIYFYPNSQKTNIINSILANENIRGVVLMAFGAGSIPIDNGLLQRIKKAISKEKTTFVVITQCMGGQVDLNLYDTGAKLFDIGVISGFDLTPEAAITKMMILLGEEDQSIEGIKESFMKNIAGEQSYSLIISQLGSEVKKKQDIGISRMRIPQKTINGLGDYYSLDEASRRISKVVLALRSAKVFSEKIHEPLHIDLYYELKLNESLDRNSDKFLASYVRMVTEEATLIQFDITNTAINRFDNNTSFTFAFNHEKGTLVWDSAEVHVYINESLD